MKEDRGPWYLLTGLAIGVVLGLIYAWRVNPVVYQDTLPDSLRAEYKDQYRVIIAAAYAANGNLARAQARLNELGDEDSARSVAVQAQRALAENRPDAEVSALGVLAVALSEGNIPFPQAAVTQPISSSVQLTSTITVTLRVPTSTAGTTLTPQATPSGNPTSSPTSILRTPNPTPTPLPSRTPTPTRGAPFVLKDARLVCNAGFDQPLLIVEAYDAAGQPVPGAEVIVQWEGNEDRFFTGLKPELGLGYADFVMTPGETYSVHLAEGGEPVPDLSANECETASRGRFWGSWQIVFVQP